MTPQGDLSQRSARGAMVLALRHVLGLIATAGSSIVLARLLEPRDVGAFIAVNAMVFLPALLLGDLGLGITLVRSKEEPTPEQWSAARRLVVRVALGCAAGVGAAAGISVLVGNTRTAQLALLCGVALVCRITRPVPTARLQRDARFGTIAVAETIENIGYLSAVLTMASLGFGAVALAGATAVKELGAAAWLWHRAPTRERAVEHGAVRTLVRAGIAPQFGSALMGLTDMFQPIVIGAILGVQALGYVSWAYSVALTPMLLVAALDRVLLPALSKLQNDADRSRVWIELAIRLNCAAVVPIVVVLASARNELISVLFASAWLPAQGLFMAFAPAIVATAMSAPLLHAFNARGATKVGMGLSVRWFALTWTFGLFATAWKGVVGFGWFYVLLQVGYLPLWVRARRELGVRVVRVAMPYLASAGVVIAGSELVRSQTEFASTFGGLVVLVAALLASFTVILLAISRSPIRDIRTLMAAVRPSQSRAARSPEQSVSETTVAPDPVARRLGYHPALDGVRAFAVVAVLVYHLNVPYTSGGFLGVDVFFALSGFLITALLVQEFRSHGRVSLFKFYGRRALRLMPALCALIVVGLMVSVLASNELADHTRWGAPFALLYLTNWVASITGRSLGLFHHTWSLAIEEQFYLLWPPLLVFWLRRGVSMRRIIAGVAALAAAGIAWTALLWSQSQSIDRVYYPLDTRASELLIGALGALWMMHSANVAKIAKPWLACVAFGGIALLMPIVSTGDGILYPFGLTLISVAAVVGVLALVVSRPSRVHQVFALPPLRHLGKISYGLYLWHFPVYELLQTRANHLPVRYLVPMQLLGAYVLALISYRLVEAPFLRRKARFAVEELPRAERPEVTSAERPEVTSAERPEVTRAERPEVTSTAGPDQECEAA